MRHLYLLALSGVLYLVLATGCQKEPRFDPSPGGSGNNNNNTPTYNVDDSTQVTTSINGVILDENNQPSSGANVRCGTQSAITGAMGVFYFKDIAISKNNGSITVSKGGYFKIIKTFMAAAGKTHFVRMQLMKRTLTATIQAATGGTVNLVSGATITFPANAFAYANGNVYNGNVQVYAKYINPQDPALHLLMPGDLRGIRSNGMEVVLNNYGIIGADLVDASGQPLVIATGKKASIAFPVPNTVQPAVVDSIPLWHFDEARARWLQEGTAVKTGGTIKADVNKFSFWGIDESQGFLRLSGVIMNTIDSTPVGGETVRLTVAGTSMTCFGSTACTGFFMSGVPIGQPIVMDIVVANPCASIIYSLNIGPFTSNTSLDTIWVSAPTTTYTLFKGYLKNCQGAPATNGYLTLYSPTSGCHIVQTSSSGYFEMAVFHCQNSTLNYSYQATEFGTSQQSAVMTGSTTTTTAHIVNLGNVYACATQPPPPAADVYVFGDENVGQHEVIKYWKNGVANNVTDGTLSSYVDQAFITPAGSMYIAGVQWDAAGYTQNAKLWVDGTATDISGSSFLNSSATGVFVNGTDLYVSYDMDNISTGFTMAKLWKNGVSTTVASSSVNFNTSCVYVSGSDVYVGGSSTPQASIISRAIIWKNGVAQYLTNGQFNSRVNKILVVGADVYAVGQDNVGANGTGRAVVWKNGVPTYLTDGISSDAMANDIFIDGTDIYVCGRRSSNGSGEVAQLWKNGVATPLSVNGSNGIAHGVFVNNGNVYVAEAGFMSGPIRVWKNNIPTLLTTGNNFNSVRSVIVK